MLLVFFGCSCAGKSSVMNYLNENFGYIYIRNISTRLSRIEEFHKTTLTEVDFLKLKSQKKLLFVNNFYSAYYGYLKADIEKAINDKVKNYMIDLGIENIDQTDEFKDIIKIVIKPHSIPFLKDNIFQSGRIERMSEIISNYRLMYAKLESKLDLENKVLILENKKNEIKNIGKTIKSVVDSLSTSNIDKRERLERVFRYITKEELCCSGLEIYKQLTNAINQIEDSVLGEESFDMPKSFLNRPPTQRLYTILPESFHTIERYSGVTLLLTFDQIVFISRFGAIEIQEKTGDDKYGLNTHFEERINKIIFRKDDFWGDGVWHPKNF